jgi:hypothetical protein
MIGGLIVMLGALTLLLGSYAVQSKRPRFAQAVPAGYRVLRMDLGHEERMGRRGPVLLRDDEWGIVGKVDLLLQGPEGEVVPVEYKSAWPNYEPGTARRSHLVQVATAFLLCQGDPRITRAPTEGWLRYVDDQGQVVPGGEVKVQNTPEARAQVLAIVERMRQALRRNAEVHRTHNTAYNCRRCRHVGSCGDAKVA